MCLNATNKVPNATSGADALIIFIERWLQESMSKQQSWRVKEAKRSQLMQGIYSGGVTPFGYDRVLRGRKNASGQFVGDLVINKDEAEWICFIFDKTAIDGCSYSEIAAMLNSRGIKTHNGKEFRGDMIKRILRNPVYKGHFSCGEVLSPKIEELVIVDDVLFDEVQFIIAQRDSAFLKSKK